MAKEKRQKMRRGILPLVIVMAALGACTASTDSGLARVGTPFDSDIAERTLAQGFATISERTLNHVTLPDIAVEGLKGLATIDPDITVHRDGDTVVLSLSDHPAAIYPAPGDDDAHGWARLAVTAAMDASSASDAIKNADMEKVLEAMFDATLSRLDVFSRYHGALEARRLRSERNGFGGIGILFDPESRGLRVRSVLENSPASMVGIKPGDLVTRVGDSDVGQLDHDAVMDLMRGPVGSEVVVVVASADGRPVLRTLRRALIVPPTVTSTVQDGILEARISSFNQHTAESLSADVRRARENLGPLLKGVILDLRGNPGGLLDQAVLAADLFIPSGIIVQTRGRHPLSNQSYDASLGDVGENLPVVVIVDGRSASAAEILAGALEDSGRAVVIGTNTYGKGTVQTVVHLPNDGEITLTWSRFYTPAGYALHGLGVLPTLCTALNDPQTAPVLEAELAHSAPVPHDLAEWRHTRVDDMNTRIALRDLCPSAARTGMPSDVILARSLINQPLLYQRAIAMSSPPAVSLAHHNGDSASEFP